MKRRFYLGALTLGLATGALILTSCSTPETRISDHPDLYQSLSARDRALVSQGQIRPGMPRNAVWLAWGSPDRKIIANMRGHPTETWIYVYYATSQLELRTITGAVTSYSSATPSTIHSSIRRRSVFRIQVRW